MSKFTRYISKQFGNPNGFIGSIMTKLMNVINQRLYKKATSLVDIKEEDNILDIGYGNGYLLKKIFNKTKSNLYGIDISSDCMRLATKRNKKAAKKNKLNLSVGDCCNLAFSDSMFQAITSINTIYFWSDTVKGLTEIKRVLMDGCSFYNIVYTKEYLDKVKYTETGFKKFLPEEYIELGKRAGFTSVRIEEIQKDKSFVVIYTK